FLTDFDGAATRLRLTAAYGYLARDHDVTFLLGEGLVGQAARSRRTIRVNAGPTGSLTLRSGLLETASKDHVVVPVLFEGELLGVIEFASVTTFSELHLSFLERLVLTIGIAVN